MHIKDVFCRIMDINRNAPYLKKIFKKFNINYFHLCLSRAYSSDTIRYVLAYIFNIHIRGSMDLITKEITRACTVAPHWIKNKQSFR